MATENTTTAKEAKKTAELNKLMETVHEVISIADRPAFGGVKPEKTKIETGKLYYVSPTHLKTSNGVWDGDNGRLIHDSENMAESIVRANGIVEPLLAAIYGAKSGELSLQDLIDGKNVPMVLKGNRRHEGAVLVSQGEHREIVEGRVPIQFVFNPSPEEEAALRHDHGDRRGLTRPEVFKQIRHLVRTTGLTQAQIGVRMYSAFYATAPEGSKTKMDVVTLKYENGVKAERGEELPAGTETCTEKEMWAARKDWMRGPLQWGHALAQLPIEVTKYVAYQMIPKLAQADGVTVNWKPLKKEDAFELIKAKTEAEKLIETLRKAGDLRKTLGIPEGESTVAAEKEYVRGKVEGLFKEQIKPIVASDGEGGDGDSEGSEGEGNTDRAKSMSRQECLDAAKMQESTIMATILRGVAGQADERRMFPELDSLLYKFELARAAQPELIARILADANEVADALK